jgi:hypothetical protein
MSDLALFYAKQEFDPTQEAQRRDWKVFQSNLFWKTVFMATPYTSLWMVDYLIKTANTSYEEFLRDPKILKRKFIDGDSRIDNSPNFEMLWSLPGRCTSFTIQVVEKLKTFDGNAYDFQLYGLGKHRLAHCKTTGVLIDSGSSCGAFRLGRGDWPTFDRNREWKWNPSESRFEREREGSFQQV